MAKKRGIVYSTNPNYSYEYETSEAQETLKPEDQTLKVSLDKKQRKGKKVTLVEGFIGKPDDLNALGKTLKAKCGVGGSTKDGQIIIQGDFVEKINVLLQEMGYNTKHIR